MYYIKRCGDKMNIILASSSPRRQEILGMFNLDFTIKSSDINEDINVKNPYELVETLAFNKAMEISKDDLDALVIGADTVVHINGEILGKPKTNEEAFNMLKSLSGKKHEVVTGVALVCKSKGIEIKSHEITNVHFKDISDEEVLSYIKTGDPLDKAGAYGIQGIASVFIEKIEGCYFNVVGLPVSRLYTLLGRIGVNLLERK